MHPLIQADELNARLDEIRVFDTRWSLTDPSHVGSFSDRSTRNLPVTEGANP